ncbi:MAG: sigma 54-interacting transcriptional regulator [Hyalangium sp.]|uniref:sigma 54-interacting transcriptional regulator n=1 Tax=Hyalangium sp. TaxID=2028555 RepID=UPI00389A3128
MRDKTLRDISTLNRGRKSGDARVPGPVPALTVVSHPVPERVGDRLLLAPLAVGREVLVSRNAPDFTPPGDGIGLALSDPGLSRKPLLFAPGKEPGAVLLDPGESRQVAVPGAAPHGPWEFSPEQVVAGVPLELGERVVLLLHLASTSASAADALGMVGISLGLQQVRSHIEQVADLDVPVLVRGETGSGKELIAQALHRLSRRRSKAFMSVNLGALTKELAASELFGAGRGAYTGAVKKEGYFQAAHGGTLFLDEVGEAPLEVQAMLLRVLETRQVFPVGEHVPVKVDVRLVAATDAQLEKQILEGRFKEPLLHRLAGYEIRVPPLRERREDIGLLFLHFVREELKSIDEGYRLKPGKADDEPWLPTSVALQLLRYQWPGNIRELRNMARQIVIDSRGQPTLRLDLRLAQKLAGTAPVPASPPHPSTTPAPSAAAGASRRKLSEHTDEEIFGALAANGWEIKKAAGQLGVARSSLYGWLERNPHVRAANRLSEEDLARHYRDCKGDLDAMSQRLKTSRWAVVRRLKELGLLQSEES